MDEQQAEHLSRVRHLREAFVAANEHLVARLREATRSWTQDALGRGVELGVVRGDLPLPLLADSFVERPWATIAAGIPDKLEAATAATPPARVTRHDAIASLEASALKIARAFDSLTPERGGRTGITNPVVGTISLYQVGEWAAAHVHRHDRQIERALAPR